MAMGIYMQTYMLKFILALLLSGKIGERIKCGIVMISIAAES